jgi:tetratricopeptide (TPR) repeat protein
LEAIERVCDPDNDLDVFEAVASLVDKSLLGRMDSSDASPRFVMLETIQEYAAERLAESGERDRFRRLHADFFLELAERGERELRGADQQRWRGILALEHDNLRSAMEWSLDGDGGRLALAIASRLWRLWLARGDLTEGRRWLEAAIGSAPTDAPRALALRGLAALALEQGDLGRSEETARQALSLDRESGDAHGELHSIGMVADCLAIRGDLAAARELYAQAEELARVLGDDRQYAANLYYLGELARLTGDLDAANARLTEALALFARLQDSLGHGATARALAEVALERGDLDWAFSLLDDAAALSLAAGYVSGLLAIIDAYARLFAKAGQPAAAATLWGAFGQVREDLGRHLDQPHEAAVREATTSSIRAALGEAAFRAAVDFGASMSLEQAVAWAREERAMDTRSSGRFLDQ